MSTPNRFAVLAGAVALACSAWAQQPPDQQYQSDQYQDTSTQAASNQVDPPTRVARLGYLSGDVSFAPAGESEWSRAQRNRPMVTGDRLFTNSGRAELQIGASIIQVDQSTSVDVLNLNDQIAQLQLTQGTLNLDVRRLRGGEVFEVDTPTIAFIADRVGDYRIDVDAQGKATTVSVRRGSGEAIGEGGKRVRVDEGHSVAFNDSQLSDYQTGDLRQPDSFDNYATQRDERYEHAPSRNYVAEEVPGYADLDEDGTWQDSPQYGHVWYPSGVAADWAPYHDGNWNWIEPYGWTYVDDTPWGFAPYHYGRWAYVDSRWGWVPGPVDVAPVYAPALVAFVGGGGFGVGISLGGPIGWFPLGPGDIYFPGYPCGHGYFNSVNISNTVVSNNVVNNYYGAFSSGTVNYAQMNYANRTAPRATTAMSTAAFAAGRPVASSAIAANNTTLANARVLPRATVAPTRASLVSSRGRAMAPPAAVTNRNVVAVNRPAATPASFAQRQTLLQQNPGRPLSGAQMRSVATRSNAAATRSNVRVAGAAGVAAPAAAARTNARATTATAPNTRIAPSTTATTTARGNASTHVRSAEFAHQANAQAKNANAPPRESATARAHASANARFERGTTSPPPRESATARTNASANARFERSASGTPPVRSSTYAAQNRANVQESSSHRVTARTNTPSEQRVQTQQTQHRAAQSTARVTEQPHTQAQYRAPQSTAHVTEQPHAQAQYRAPQSTARVTEQPHAQTQYRAPQSTARVTEQQHAQAQYRAPQSTARVTEQQHAQAQYRAPPQQQAARVSEPPHAQAQRATTQPAPQRHARNKDEKQNGGGGG